MNTDFKLFWVVLHSQELNLLTFAHLSLFPVIGIRPLEAESYQYRFKKIYRFLFCFVFFKS